MVFPPSKKQGLPPSSARYVSNAASIGRRDFTEEDFDFGDEDEKDEGVLDMRKYNPRTSILSPDRRGPAGASPPGNGVTPPPLSMGQGIVQLASNGKVAAPPSNLAVATPPSNRTFDQSKLYQVNKAKQSEAAALHQSEMQAAFKAEEEAREAKYKRRQSQMLASDEMKKATKAIAEANAAKRQQEEATNEKLSAMALSEKEKEEMERALKESAEAQEKRLRVEEEVRIIKPSRMPATPPPSPSSF